MHLATGGLRRAVRSFMGRRRFQAMFMTIHRAALIGLNIGPADDLTKSGELRVLRSLTAGSVVFDVGANVGRYSAAAE